MSFVEIGIIANMALLCAGAVYFVIVARKDANEPL